MSTTSHSPTKELFQQKSLDFREEEIVAPFGKKPVPPLLLSGVLAKKTPARLQLLLSLIVLASIILTFISSACTEQYLHTVRTIAVDAAPSVVAAHKIKIATEAMDADITDELLSPVRRDQNCSDAMKDFEAKRQTVARSLIDAARNITYGKDEILPLEIMQDSLGTWLMQVQASRVFHNNGQDREAIMRYREALATLEKALLPAADLLDKANSDALEAVYTSQRSASNTALSTVLAASLLLTASLIYIQIYLAITFRRRFNLCLLLATLSAIAFGTYSFSAYSSSSFNLREAKEDAYNSVIALLDARSDSYDANAAESRWLLDSDNKDIHEKSFLEKVGHIARLEPGSTFEQLVAEADASLTHQKTIQVARIHGSLASELNNITFAGEAESAIDALKKFAAYYALDTKIRHLENTGKHAEAVSFCLSYKPGESNWAFAEYDAALDKVLDINQRHMQTHLETCSGALKGLLPAALLVPLFIIFLAYLGIRPRLAEY